MTVSRKKPRSQREQLSTSSNVAALDSGASLKNVNKMPTDSISDKLEGSESFSVIPQNLELGSHGEESDSSSDEEVNPVGNIPMRWYDGYDHIGYGRDGQKIIPRNRPSALELAADPNAWRRIYDDKNDEEIVLTHDELKAIARMRAGRYPSGKGDEDDELVAWSGPVIQHALTSGSEPKRRFLPSRHEARLVVKLVRGMRAGKIRKPSEIAKEVDEEENSMYHYDAWAGFEAKTRDEMTKSERARDIMRVPAPRPPLPTHAESYNPPQEYLPSAKEVEEWEGLDPEERGTPYLPSQYSSLREVPLYKNFVQERFERCLDLYLAVRVIKNQQQANADDLVPDLPNPRDLRPFPTDVVTSYGPLSTRARSIEVHPGGQWLLAGCDDGCVRVWDTSTGYLQHTWDLTKQVGTVDGAIPAVTWVGWCPRESIQVFAAAIGYSLVVVCASNALGVSADESLIAIENIRDGDLDDKLTKAMESAGIQWVEYGFKSEEQTANADDLPTLEVIRRNETQITTERKAANKGDVGQGVSAPQCVMLTISHPKLLRTCCWHRKGEYIACAGKDSSGGVVAIHRLRHRSSQLPFKRKTASVQAVKFHPTRPFFLVATMHHVRIYNLALQEIVKTLKPGVSWISSIDVHPSGDHVLVTSYDKRLCWFDLDLSVKPYKAVRNHDKAVRIAKFHPRLPLFADGSDDGSTHIFHGMVYDDLAKNALIVPVKKIHRCSGIVDSLGVLDVAWHPRLPWLFTSGADCAIHLLSDCSQG